MVSFKQVQNEQYKIQLCAFILIVFVIAHQCIFCQEPIW